MGISGGPYIIRDSSLLLELDASDADINYRNNGRIWNDLSGNNNSGSIVNGAALNNDSFGSFNFNGINSYILISRPVQDDFTLSCWFKTTQSTGSGQWYNGVGLIDGEVAGTVNDFGLSMVAGRVAFGTGNTDITISSSLTYNDNTWHQATATRIKSTGVIALYVDGISVASSTGNTNSLSASSALRLGSIQTNSATGFFSGSISTVQIYNRALPSSEVQSNYSQFQSRFSSITSNIITYVTLNQAAAIGIFNNSIEFSNIVVGYPSYASASAFVSVNELTI
jgi:hypothetical protein